MHPLCQCHLRMNAYVCDTLCRHTCLEAGTICEKRRKFKSGPLWLSNLTVQAFGLMFNKRCTHIASITLMRELPRKDLNPCLQIARPRSSKSCKSLIQSLFVTKASSYRAAIRTAKGVVADVGEASASSSVGLVQLSKCSEAHSERDGYNVIGKKFGLTLDVPFTPIPKAPGVTYPGQLCLLKLKSWMNFIVTMNCVHLLCGLQQKDTARERAILESFWKRFKAVRPQHSMWKLVEEGKLNLQNTIPLVCHGDEGRGRKRSGFLVLSWSSVLGFGTLSANAARKEHPYRLQRLNYVGSTYLTRMVTSALPKMAHDAAALNDILHAVAHDANEMMREGVENSRGEKYFAVCINIVGDWQWLAKCGSFLRSWSNCNKRPLTDKSEPKGMCHLCLADQVGVPWENYKVYDVEKKIFPAWYPTMYSVDPWETKPPLSAIPSVPGEEPGFYAFDLFHSFHLGVGKTLAASCLALASELMVATAVDVRLEELTNLYQIWAEENKKSLFFTTFTRANLGWMDTSCYPNGQWSKGHVTTCVLEFFCDFAQKRDLTGHPLLKMSLEACLEISECLKRLYENDVWIHQTEALRISHHGMRFLELYKCLAFESFHSGKALYANMPKGHALDHTFFALYLSSVSNKWSLNPLICSVQMFEDFIGRCSRAARRTSPQQVVKRSLERCLQASYKAWYEAGYIKD